MAKAKAAAPETAARKDGYAAYEAAGAAQLAKQKNGKGQNETALDPVWAIMRQHLEARLNMLRAWRFSWAQHWQLLETYILPRRGIFINTAMPTPNTMIRGLPINQNIVDPTGTQAMRICAAGLMSGLMSPGRPWKKLKPAAGEVTELDDEAQKWLEDVNDRMDTVMARSNFYDIGAQMFEDLTVFGSGPMIIYEDDEDVVRCYAPCPGEYFLASSSANRVESMYRQFVMTVAQIVEMFGIENCPSDVQGLWKTKGSSLEVERLVAHAIEPNFEIDRGFGVGVVPGGFTWREYYWVWGMASAKPLSVKGFWDQPHVCPRWGVTSNDAYGRSVAMDVLPDIMQLQVETMRKAEAIEKLVRPPLMADMAMKNEPSSILPGHVTYVASIGSDKGMRPIYTVNPDIRHMMEDLKEIQIRVKTGFFNDLFLMMAQADKQMTAYEVAQKQQEKLQVLGPVIERFHNEFASPAIKRIFRIMERRKLLPPLPKSLIGKPIAVEYVSVLSIAQKAAATAGMEAFAKMTGYLAGAYPEAKTVLDPVEFLQIYGRMVNAPAKVTRSPEEIQKINEQQQQAAQEAQQMAQAQQLAQGAQTLSDTQLGTGNALDAMIGGQQNAAPGGGQQAATSGAPPLQQG
jgi:hypothetical protein